MTPTYRSAHHAAAVFTSLLILATATACSASAHAIGDSFKIIERGAAEMMICGGAEATVTPMGIGGFAAMKALSLSSALIDGEVVVEDDAGIPNFSLLQAELSRSPLRVGQIVQTDFNHGLHGSTRIKAVFNPCSSVKSVFKKV